VKPKLAEYAREHAMQLIEMEVHLEIDTLDAYYRCLLGSEEQEATRYHIVLCADCRELLRGYIEFLGDDLGESRVSLAELMAAWEELRQKRSGTSQPPVPK
jgi:hypothetical protein